MKYLKTFENIDIENNFFYASFWNNLEMFKKILKDYPNIDINKKNNNGVTALIEASTKNYIGIAKLLIKHPKIDVNIQDKNGDTALIKAAFNENLKILKELLKHPNLDWKIKDNNNKYFFEYLKNKDEIISAFPEEFKKNFPEEYLNFLKKKYNI